MATQRLRYVNTDSTAGGNGTTNATTGPNRAYATLQSALSAEESAGSNLVSADQYLEILCDGSVADTTAVTVTGFTTDDTRRIIIRCSGAARHAGIYDNTKYRLEVGGLGVITLAQGHVTLDGLQVMSTAVDGDDGRGIFLTNGVASGRLIINACIIRYLSSGTPTTSGNCHGIRANTGESAWTLIITNNILFDFRADGMFINPQTLNETAIIYNNTVCDCGASGLLLTGNSTGEKLYVKDNIIQGCTGSDFNLDGSAWGGAYVHAKNVTEDNTSPDGATYQSKTIVFVNEASNDFHLSDTDTVAFELGDDLSGDAQYAFNTDIDGETRSAPWSIGADQPSGGGGPGPGPGSGIGFGFDFNGGFQ